MIKLYTDAATKGNPGPTGLGALVLADHQQFQLTSTVANCDNHQGEFAAAEFGFHYLLQHFPTAQTIGKNYTKHYQAELDRLNALPNRFPTVVTQWIPDAQNQGAHHLANQALQSVE